LDQSTLHWINQFKSQWGRFKESAAV
jgi:hypothetical protein